MPRPRYGGEHRPPGGQVPAVVTQPGQSGSGAQQHAQAGAVHHPQGGAQLQRGEQRRQWGEVVMKLQGQITREGTLREVVEQAEAFLPTPGGRR